MNCYIYNTSLPGYDNDIRALVQAFYPGAGVIFVKPRDNPTHGQSDTVNVSEEVCHVIHKPEKGAETKSERIVSDTENAGIGDHGSRGNGSAGTSDGDTSIGGISDAGASAADISTGGVSNANISDGDISVGDICIDIDKLAPKVERDSIRFNEKTNLKRELYRYLSELTGKQLPWGTLTGIRPVRIPEMLNADGRKTEAELKAELKSSFLISDRKLDLMLDIEGRERRVLSGIDYRHGCSIYIGIPFCPTRCIYCSFASNQLSEADERPDRYVDAVCRELDALCDGRKDSEFAHFDKSKLQTLYIGGGTPTALDERQLERLLDKIAELFGIPYEYTIEAGRPDSINAAKLDIIKAHGAQRISVNPQSFNQKTLDAIGRRHTVEETIAAYELARNKGFDNINMDIIMGLPGENIDDVKHTLRVIEELKPDSLTVHALAVKRASRLSTEGKAWGGIERKGSSPDIREADELAEMTELGAECAERLKLHPYYLYRQKNMAGNQDNVGYASEGKECLYNILMMEEKHSVYGIGAGASTKLVLHETENNFAKNDKGRIIRTENVKNLNDYLVYSF